MTAPRLSAGEIEALRSLSRMFPTIDAAAAERARIAPQLGLPKPTIHVISDIHGEHVKLRHVLNNASGRLRPLVEKELGGEIPPADLQEMLSLLFYPRETLERQAGHFADDEAMRSYCRRVVPLLWRLFAVLAADRSAEQVRRLFPEDFASLFLEMWATMGRRDWTAYQQGVFDSLIADGRALQFLRLTARLLRHLAVDELIVAGDFWDRGPRGDEVLAHVMRQPNVAITWGNHDVSWLGASLGCRALIANVLRISCRYRRLTQIEEGYGITLQPLEHLVRACYADDPATCFLPKGEGLRDRVMMARMQKAAAIIQFKTEAAIIDRHPDWGLDNRRLLHCIDHAAGTVTINGTRYPLRDSLFPTVDPDDPYRLNDEETDCIERIRQSFRQSGRLREQMQYLVDHGRMWVARDRHLIFHGCVPIDQSGEFLPLTVDGHSLAGRASFDAIETVVARALDQGAEADLDFLWYLWSGPRSPLFGKDKIATFENDFVSDHDVRAEKKNAYFGLIHDVAFCEKILREFGVDPVDGLIVNGHVPVKVDQGESPLKRSGKAITIDGAFSQAYGDHGFTLILDARETLLARHHHFESVEDALATGTDIIPTLTTVREWPRPRLIADTERGEPLRIRMELLGKLIGAYERHDLRQQPPCGGIYR